MAVRHREMAERTKIVFLCRQDFANVSTEIAHALRTETSTHDARVIAMTAHPFRYARPHDLDLVGATPEAVRDANAFLNAASTVVWCEEATAFGDDQSTYGRENLLAKILGVGATKRVVVFHAGIAYRDGHARYNALDAQTFDGQLCSPDLLRLGNAGARCVWGKPMVTDLDAVDRLWKERRAYGKLVVTHSPSNHAYKGTALIRRVMKRVQHDRRNVEYREVGAPLGGHLDHAELIAARDQAVCHIDQYHPGIGGIGIAAFEAMVRGVIPLASTNRIVDAAYAQWRVDPAEFPAIPLVFPKQETASEVVAERALVKLLMAVCSLPLDELESRGRAAAAWTHAHLSPAVYARHWLAQLDQLPAARASRGVAA